MTPVMTIRWPPAPAPLSIQDQGEEAAEIVWMDIMGHATRANEKIYKVLMKYTFILSIFSELPHPPPSTAYLHPVLDQPTTRH